MEEKIRLRSVSVNIWRGEGPPSRGRSPLRRGEGGKGEPLFVLTGWNGTFPENKEMLEALARENFSVYGIELPGTGKSDAPGKDWVFSDYVPLIDEILAYYGLSEGIILGHSFGCVAALKLARYFPHRVKRLVISNPPILSPKNLWGVGVIFPLAFLLFTMLIALPCWLLSKVIPFKRGIFVRFVRRLGRQYPYLTRSGGIMRKILSIVISDDTIEDARNVKVPALIVGSEKGGITPLSNSLALHKALRGSDLVVIPGAPHDFTGVWAQKFSGIVRDWVMSKEL